MPTVNVYYNRKSKWFGVFVIYQLLHQQTCLLFWCCFRTVLCHKGLWFWLYLTLLIILLGAEYLMINFDFFGKAYLGR